jgi:hypothetical protein
MYRAFEDGSVDEFVNGTWTTLPFEEGLTIATDDGVVQTGDDGG